MLHCHLAQWKPPLAAGKPLFVAVAAADPEAVLGHWRKQDGSDRGVLDYHSLEAQRRQECWEALVHLAREPLAFRWGSLEWFLGRAQFALRCCRQEAALLRLAYAGDCVPSRGQLQVGSPDYDVAHLQLVMSSNHSGNPHPKLENLLMEAIEILTAFVRLETTASSEFLAVVGVDLLVVDGARTGMCSGNESWAPHTESGSVAQETTQCPVFAGSLDTVECVGRLQRSAVGSLVHLMKLRPQLYLGQKT